MNLCRDPITIDPNLCSGCGICTRLCPFGIPQKTLEEIFDIIRCAPTGMNAAKNTEPDCRPGTVDLRPGHPMPI